MDERVPQYRFTSRRITRRRFSSSLIITWTVVLVLLCGAINPCDAAAFLGLPPTRIANQQQRHYQACWRSTKLPLAAPENNKEQPPEEETADAATSTQPNSKNKNKSESGYDAFTDEYSRTLKRKNDDVGGGLLRRMFRRYRRIDPGQAAYRQRMLREQADWLSEMMVGKRRKKGTKLLPPRTLPIIRKVKKPGSLILVRHGQSVGSNSSATTSETFTGWSDPELTERGIYEVQHAARLLREAGYDIDVVFTSRLKRAIHSTWAMLRELDESYLPVFNSWRLNERSYGALTGLSKAEVASMMGPLVVQKWRRDPRAVPPPLTTSDPRWPGHERRFADLIPKEQIPLSESLCDCINRVQPLWEDKIKIELEVGHNVLVVGHGSTLRGLIKHILDLDDDTAQSVRIPPGSPIVYDFDTQMQPMLSGEKDAIYGFGGYGTFLDKPGLLEKALEREGKWKEHVPGFNETTAPDSRVSSSFERSLSKLMADRELEELVDDDEEASTVAVLEKEKDFSAPSPRDGIDGDPNGRMAVKGDIQPVVIHGHPCLAPLPNGVSLPGNIKLPGRKGAVIVMIRHGATEHNQLGLFTGWEDPQLTEEGRNEAVAAGKLLKQYGFEFDVVYTSWLFRAIETAWLVLDALDTTWLPIIKSWRLNERHYGILTGKSKKMVSRLFGSNQLKSWRRGYKVKPPPVNSFSVDYPGNDKRYRKFMTDLPYSASETIIRTIGRRKWTPSRQYPKTESLHCCMKRTVPYFVYNIVPEAVDKGKRVLIASSENAIRGLLMHLMGIPDELIEDINVPNGVPLIFDVKSKSLKLLDDGSGMDPLKKYDFGPAADYLFRSGGDAQDEECDISEMDDDTWKALSAAFSTAGTAVPKV